MIASRLVTSQVWLITGSQSLYGPDILDQVADQSRQIAEHLAASSEIPVEVRWLPVVTDSDQIDRVLSDANTSQECIGVIAWMHTFSPAKMWIRGLKTLRKPLLHLHTQFGVELPWHSIDMNFMNLNQAAHGDQCGVNSGRRRRRCAWGPRCDGADVRDRPRRRRYARRQPHPTRRRRHAVDRSRRRRRVDRLP